MKKHTKCLMNEICRKPHRDGECERNCYYNTIDVKTNADRIRAMTDDELAKWIASDVLNLTGGSLAMATEAWLKWLKREEVVM